MAQINSATEANEYNYTRTVVDITDKILGGKARAKKPFRMAAKDGVGEIFIFDDIGAGFFMDGITAKSFADDLKALGKIRILNIFINSPGGFVFDGVAIFNQLKRHSARKVVFIDGIAASIASVIAMAGDEINIAANAFLMIHKPRVTFDGTDSEHIEVAAKLTKIGDSILNTYAARTGTPENVIADMMAAETWMNAEEAVELGFADKITEEVAIAAKFDLTQFQNVPEDVAAKLDLAKNPPKIILGGMDLASKDGSTVFVGANWSEEIEAELQPLTVGKDFETGKSYVLGEWPERTAVSSELLAATLPGIEVDESHLTITCENGTAEYVEDGEDRFGNSTWRLIESTYEHQPWPLEQAGEPGDGVLKLKEAAASLAATGALDDQSRAPSLAITKMRQHIQKRGIVRKGDDETAATA